MMYIKDSLILAFAKLKTRKLRTSITLIISSLLFIVLSSLSMFVNGMLSSFDEFSSSGLSSKALLEVRDLNSDAFNGVSNNQELIAQAKLQFESFKNSKAAKARELGVPYDPTSEVSPVEKFDESSPEFLNITHPVAKKIIDEYNRIIAGDFFGNLNKFDQQYNSTATYIRINNNPEIFSSSNNSRYFFNAVQGQTEIIAELTDNFGLQDIDKIGSPLHSINSGLSIVDDDMLNHYLIEGASFDTAAVPVIVPFNIAEEILDKKFNASNTKEAKLQYIKELRQSISGLKFTMCVRGYDAQQDILEAKNSYHSYVAQQNDQKNVQTEYIRKPASIPCTEPEYVFDNRTADQKNQDLNIEALAQFGNNSNNYQQLVDFKIVGVNSSSLNFETDSNFNASGIISSILSPDIGSGWMVPRSAISKLPFTELDQDINKKIRANITYIKQFQTVKDAKNFRDDLGCKFENVIFEENGADISNCTDAGRVFYINEFIGTAFTIDQIRGYFNKAYNWVSVVFSVISGLILMGTIGKIIADSRRESAVFRAIGAKRSQIAQIYITYTIMLSLIVFVASLLVGTIVVLYLNARYSESATINAIIHFSSNNFEQKFTFVGFDITHAIRLLLTILASAVLSSLLPIANHVRRNPIKDMRDER